MLLMAPLLFTLITALAAGARAIVWVIDQAQPFGWVGVFTFAAWATLALTMSLVAAMVGSGLTKGRSDHTILRGGFHDDDA